MPRPSSAMTGRKAAALQITRAAERFPDVPPLALYEMQAVIRDLREARLGQAIMRVTIERWLTLEFLLGQGLTRPFAALEPRLRGILLTAAAQIVFMDRLPRHAVVDEAVKLARALVRPAAAGLVNAALRRLCELARSAVHGEPWTPANDRLPLVDGYVPLARGVLPDPASFEDHLALATSHPHDLVAQWRQTLGDGATIDLCLHSLQQAPTIVALEHGFDFASAGEVIVPHIRPDFGVWQGDHEKLSAFLAIHPHRRVQDVASAAPVARLADLPFDPASVRLAIDLCAGRGTKTRQLAALVPEARIIASDPDPDRMASLASAARSFANIEVTPSDEITPERNNGSADLVLTDVPCSNTGVLARRLEARYRYTERSRASLERLQRRIVERATTLLRPRGKLLYATCSLDPRENEMQIEWFTQHLPLRPLFMHTLYPGGSGGTYQDGSFAALMERK